MSIYETGSTWDSFLSTVAACMLGMRDCRVNESLQSGGFPQIKNFWPIQLWTTWAFCVECLGAALVVDCQWINELNCIKLFNKKHVMNKIRKYHSFWEECKIKQETKQSLFIFLFYSLHTQCAIIILTFCPRSLQVIIKLCFEVCLCLYVKHF